MLHAPAPLPPVEAPQAPTRIVLGAYLRGLRETKGETLRSAACVVRGSVSALSRWERAESPIPPSACGELLRHYGVSKPHIDYLVRNLPQQHYVRDASQERGNARRAPFDHWTDIAGAEAMARYIAVMRMASKIIEYSSQVPAGLRTQAYRKAVLDPALCPREDEPVLGLPRWVRHMPWPQGQQRTVLLDETMLIRPVGGPQAMAHQLRHLASLIRSDASGSGVLDIRILPMSPVLFVHTINWPAEVVLHGHRLVTGFSLAPVYETGSGAARRVSAGLREALSCAYGREDTYELIRHAADAMEQSPTP
nr:Scr1 family TA system antitoxin-like transcriptional regulator [Streptomyces sp. A1499]